MDMLAADMPTGTVVTDGENAWIKRAGRLDVQWDGTDGYGVGNSGIDSRVRAGAAVYPPLETAPEDEGDDEDGEHSEGDGCAIYLTGYAVKMDDGSQIDVEDLEIGDAFEDPAYPGDLWLVNDSAIVDDEVHLDIEKVD